VRGSVAPASMVGPGCQSLICCFVVPSQLNNNYLPLHLLDGGIVFISIALTFWISKRSREVGIPDVVASDTDVVDIDDRRSRRSIVKYADAAEVVCVCVSVCLLSLRLLSVRQLSDVFVLCLCLLSVAATTGRIRSQAARPSSITKTNSRRRCQGRLISAHFS
jgi:hypothetical protein